MSEIEKPSNKKETVEKPVEKRAETASAFPIEQTQIQNGNLERQRRAAEEQADRAKIQEIRESLGVFEMKPVVEEQHVIDAIQTVMLDDLRSGSEQGPYTEIRQNLSEVYGFNYDTFADQVHTALEQDKEPAEVEASAKEQLQKLIEQVWEDRKVDLEQWSALLSESVGQNQESIKSIHKNLEQFYGTDFQSEAFQINLTPHPQEKMNLAIPSEEQLGELTLYVPRIKTINPEERRKAAEDLIVDSFHELSHQQLQTESFSELVKSVKQTDEYKQALDMYCEGQEPFYDFTKEAVTNYIDAYLRQTQFHREAPKESEHARDVYEMSSWINTDLASEYIKEGKQVDLEFVKKLFQLMNE